MALVSSSSDSEEKTLVFNQTVSNQHSSISEEADSIAIHLLNDDYSYQNDDGLNTHGIVIYPLYKQVNNRWIPVQGGGDFIRLTSTSGDISVSVHTTQRGATGYQQILGRALYTMIVPPAQQSVSLQSAQHIVLHTRTEFPGVNDYVQAKYTSTVALTGKIDAQLVAQGSNRIVLEASGKQIDERVVEGWAQQAESVLLSAQAKLTLIGQQNEIITQAPVADRRFVLNISNGQMPSGENLRLVATHGHNLVAINTDAVVKNNQLGHYPMIEAIRLYGQSRVKMLSEQGDNIIQVGNKNEVPMPYGKVNHAVGVLSTHLKEISNAYSRYAGNMQAQAKNNIINIYAPNAQSKYAIRSMTATADSTESNVLLTAIEGDNRLWLDNQVISSAGVVYGVVAEKQSKIALASPKGNNQIQLGNKEDEQHEGYTGQSVGLYSAQSAIVLRAQHNQMILHSPKSMQPVAISARGLYTEAPNIFLNASDTNTVYSLSRGITANTQAKVVLHATDANQIEAGSTAITSWDRANVQLSAGKMNNISAGNTALLTATEGQIAIEGPVNIQAPLAADARTNSKIAILYEKTSQIQGNLRATDKGMIDVRSKGSTMTLTGDSMAMNQGVINLQLTPESILTGKIDNSSAYQHADYQRFFVPVSGTGTLPEVTAAGEVNLSLANNAVWNMTGQSWVSRLGGTGGIINLRHSLDNSSPTLGRALHIDALEGKQRFVLSLNKDDYTQSDMLYIKQGTTDEQTLVIQNLDELAASMRANERVRFATVSHSLNEFREGRIYRSDAGLFEQLLKVHYVSRANESEQDTVLDSRINGTEFTLEKSGDEYIRQQYDGEESKNVYLIKIADPSNHLPERPPVDEKPGVEEPITTPEEPVEPPIVDQPVTTPEEPAPISPPSVNRPAMMAIQHIPALSLRYLTDLDTYTKREGTQAYVNPAQKAGFWVRVSRLGLKDDFSLKGNTYEIGYDRFMRNDTKRKHKWGVSYTYGTIHGDFTTWRANAHLKKHMLSLYSTNHYGNYDQNAYYNDNAVRIGKLIHDYRIYRENGKLWGDGDYHQYFASVSTEHGYRAWLNKAKTWYVTPQIQLQYSYLEGKSYQSSNHVNMILGHVNSLIGRLGVDAVKVLDKETQTRIYARASILHEFLGKQHIQAHDRTGSYHRTFNMKGTWGVVGGGFSIIPDKNTYIFLDGEKTFGAHRDGYNFRVGLSWRFN